MGAERLNPSAPMCVALKRQHHLDVGQAGFFKHLTTRLVSQAFIKALCAALRMQHQFMVAASERFGLLGAQHAGPLPGPP